MTQMHRDSKHIALLAASALVLGTVAAFGIRRMSAAAAHRAPARVRPAGPAAMEFPPEEWDMVDEQLDESFPASDPPGNY